MALYVPSKNLLFVHIIKCAGNSVRKSLLHYAPDSYEVGTTHCSAKEALDILTMHPPVTSSGARRWRAILRLKRSIEEYLSAPHHDLNWQWITGILKTALISYPPPASPLFVFTVVRNPYDLISSLFHFLKSRDDHPEVLEMDFSAFLNWCIDRDKKQGGIRQSDYVYDTQGVCLADKILFYESISEEWPPFLSQFGISNASFPHENRTPSRSVYQKHFADQSLRNTMNRAFHSDFKTFGYSREL